MQITNKICNYQKFYLPFALISLVSGLIFQVFVQNAPDLWGGVIVGYSLGGTILFFHVIFKSILLWLNKNKSLSGANRQKIFKSKKRSSSHEDAPPQASGLTDSCQKITAIPTQTSTPTSPLSTSPFSSTSTPASPFISAPHISSSTSTPEVKASTNIYTGINQENALAFVNEQLSKRPYIEIIRMDEISGRLKNLAQLYFVLLNELYHIQKNFPSKEEAWKSTETVNKARELFATAYACSQEAFAFYKEKGIEPHVISLLNVAYGIICKMGKINFQSPNEKGEVSNYEPAGGLELSSHQRRLFGGQDLDDVRLLYNSFCKGFSIETSSVITNKFPPHEEGEFSVHFIRTFPPSREELEPENRDKTIEKGLDSSPAAIQTSQHTSSSSPSFEEAAQNVHRCINHENALAFAAIQLETTLYSEIVELPELPEKLNKLIQLYLIFLNQLYHIQQKFPSQSEAWKASETINKAKEFLAIAYACSWESVQFHMQEKKKTIGFCLFHVVYGRIIYHAGRIAQENEEGEMTEVYLSKGPELFDHVKRLFDGGDLEDVRHLYNFFCKEIPIEYRNPHYFPHLNEQEGFPIYELEQEKSIVN